MSGQRRVFPGFAAGLAALALFAGCRTEYSPTLHVTIEVDRHSAIRGEGGDVVDAVMRVIEKRIKEWGPLHPVLKRAGADRIEATIPGVPNPERLIGVMAARGASAFQLTDMAGGFARALPGIDRALLRAGVAVRAPTRAETPTDVEQMLSAPAGPPPQPQGGPLGSLIRPGQLPGQFLVPEEDVPRVDSLIHHEVTLRGIPGELSLAWGAQPLDFGSGLHTRLLYALQTQPLLPGEFLTDAVATRNGHQPVLSFELTPSGGRLFEEMTRRHVDQYLALTLDGVVCGGPAVISGPIGRRGQVDMSLGSFQDVQEVAILLKTGALPAPVRIVDSRLEAGR